MSEQRDPYVALNEKVLAMQQRLARVCDLHTRLCIEMHEITKLSEQLVKAAPPGALQHEALAFDAYMDGENTTIQGEVSFDTAGQPLERMRLSLSKLNTVREAAE